MTVLTVLASLGGVVTFAGAIYVVLRGAFSQAQAIRDNTTAVKRLTERLDAMDREHDSTRESVAWLMGKANEAYKR